MDKSATTMWDINILVKQNLRGRFLTACWIKAKKNVEIERSESISGTFSLVSAKEAGNWAAVRFREQQIIYDLEKDKLHL